MVPTYQSLGASTAEHRPCSTVEVLWLKLLIILFHTHSFKLFIGAYGSNTSFKYLFAVCFQLDTVKLNMLIVALFIYRLKCLILNDWVELCNPRDR